MLHLSRLWDGVFNIFLDAICRQIDNELEAGTDYLRQEVNNRVKSFQGSPHDPGSSPLADSHPLTHAKPPTLGSHDEPAPRAVVTTSKDPLVTKETVEEAGVVRPVNPPIGLSDNGWGRKRRRLSSDNLDDSGLVVDGTSQNDIIHLIEKMQHQLDEQSNKLTNLTTENEAVCNTRCHFQA